MDSLATRTPSVQEILDGLSTALTDLERAQSAKSEALRLLDTEALHRIAEEEARIARDLSSQTPFLSATSTEDAGAARTVASVLALLPEAKDPITSTRVRALRTRAERLKRTIAMNWLSTWRLNEYVGEMLSLLAQAGRPTQSAHHGLVFDSTA